MSWMLKIYKEYGYLIFKWRGNTYRLHVENPFKLHCLRDANKKSKNE
jgi:hypothetical protein